MLVAQDPNPSPSRLASRFFGERLHAVEQFGFLGLELILAEDARIPEFSELSNLARNVIGRSQGWRPLERL